MNITKKFYWSSKPGFFVSQKTGEEVLVSFVFDGTVTEWWQSLTEVIYDLYNYFLLNGVRPTTLLCGKPITKFGASIARCIEIFHPDILDLEVKIVDDIPINWIVIDDGVRCGVIEIKNFI